MLQLVLNAPDASYRVYKTKLLVDLIKLICFRPVPADVLVVEVWNKYSVQVAFSQFDDRTWVRLSANVYNTKDDYLKLRDALIDFFELSK